MSERAAEIVIAAESPRAGGTRQPESLALYASAGYHRIACPV